MKFSTLLKLSILFKTFLLCVLVTFGMSATQGGEKGARPQMAVYRWGAANPNGGAKAVEAFGRWVGCPDVWAVDFEPTDRWDSISGGDWQLGEWGEWKRKNPQKRRLILSVPLLPGPWDRSGSYEAGKKEAVSLEAGARGDYNLHFQKLAQNLVRHGLNDSILRLGWEMNGGWYTWRAGGAEEHYAAYFRQIVQTMRAVPGAEKLEFCWNPALGWQQFPADRCYPGDEWVDYVGLDVYDDSWATDTYPLEDSMSLAEMNQRRERAWNQVVWGGSYGIRWYRDFARQHGKPLCFPEWGISRREDQHGGLDNAAFIENVHDFLTSPDSGIAWHAYFDVQAPDGHHQLSPGLRGDEKLEFPAASKKFLRLFR